MVRHPVSRIPSTYVGLEKWLEERWRDKVSHLTINAPLIAFLRRLCLTSSTPLPPSSARPHLEGVLETFSFCCEG